MGVCVPALTFKQEVALLISGMLFMLHSSGVYALRNDFFRCKISRSLCNVYRSAALFYRNYGDTSKNLCLAKDKAKAEQEELDIHDTA